MIPRPCFACGHVHDPASPGACWDAACLSSCPVCHPSRVQLRDDGPAAGPGV